MLFDETYSGSSDTYLVNHTSAGKNTSFTSSNGLLYGLGVLNEDRAYYYSGSLLTPYADRNNFSLPQIVLGAVTGLWRPSASTNEIPACTYTAISPATSSEPIKIFQVGWQYSGTVSENMIYIAGTRIFQPEPADITSNAILSSGPSTGFPNNLPETSGIFAGSPPESVVSIWYNQTAANKFQGANISYFEQPNVIMTTYVDSVNPACYHLYGYNPAASQNETTGQWEPSIGGGIAVLVPGQSVGTNTCNAPSALCGFGFMWQTSPNSATVLTPDGSTYYYLTFVGQTTNAKAALSSGYTTIMGDGNGVFWVVTYTLSNSSFYVGNGQAEIVTITQPEAISPGTPIPLPCFVPCTFGNNLGEKS